MTSLRCRGERGRAWLAKSMRAQPSFRPALPLRTFLSLNSALVGAIFRHCRGSHFLVVTYAKGQRKQRCPSCVCVLFAYLRVPCPRLCVCQAVRLGRYRVPASACGTSAGPLCAYVCCCLRVTSLCLRVCFVLHLVDILNCGEFPNPIDICSSSG